MPEEMEPLDCTLEDFFKVKGYSSVDGLAEKRPQLTQYFELRDGGMHLLTVTGKIAAIPFLDEFVAKEFERFANPATRQFGENLFTIVGAPGTYRVGHLERYCGTTLTLPVATLVAKSGGLVAGAAHTHPIVRGDPRARQITEDGAEFGPGDWTVMAGLIAPFYLYTPRRKVQVMEYDGDLVTVRRLGGKARKWRVAARKRP